MRREPMEHLVLKRHMLLQMVEEMCKQLDLTDTEYEGARRKYESVSRWLSESRSPFLADATIYPHGSIAMGTAVRQVGGNEFDVDLVAFITRPPPAPTPQVIKQIVGDRLKEHETYREMLEEKRRCWRLNYAGEFHMDITPSIPNPKCSRGGELVSDRELQRLKPTNPRHYVMRFEQYAALSPSLSLYQSNFAEARADVVPLPRPTLSKPLLKRIVQLLKRHRDVFFLARGLKDVAPISIIVTTLAAWSYADCVSRGQYEDEYEFLLDVIRRMPEFIQTNYVEGRSYYVVPNETTEGENFAERWNQDARLAQAFFAWHRDASEYVAGLLQAEGIDTIAKRFKEGFQLSSTQTNRLSETVSDKVTMARQGGTAMISSAAGVAASILHPGNLAAAPVRRNTFFGR